MLCAVCFARNVGEPPDPKTAPCIIILDSLNNTNSTQTVSVSM